MTDGPRLSLDAQGTPIPTQGAVAGSTGRAHIHLVHRAGPRWSEVYTIGLTSFGLPELSVTCVPPLSVARAGAVLTGLARLSLAHDLHAGDTLRVVGATLTATVLIVPMDLIATAEAFWLATVPYPPAVPAWRVRITDLRLHPAAGRRP